MKIDLPVAGVTIFKRYDPGSREIYERAIVVAVKIQEHEGKVHHWTATMTGASGIAKIDSGHRPINRGDWHPDHWLHNPATNKLIAPAPAETEFLAEEPSWVHQIAELQATVAELRAALEAKEPIILAPVTQPVFVPAPIEPVAEEPAPAPVEEAKPVGRAAKGRG